MSATSIALDKGLPSNVDAERFVLGSILLNDSLYIQAAGELQPDDFSLEKHRRIFSRMGELAERGERIDRVTVANELMRFGELESCDGLSYLVSLDDGLPQTINIDGYIRIVKDKAVLRRIIFASQHLMNRCLIGEEDADEILAGAEETLLKLGEDRVKSGLVSPRQVIDEYQGGQGHQHGIHKAGREDQRAACRRTVHPGGAAFNGEDGAGAEHRAARGHQGEADGSGLLARNVEGVAADPHAVRHGSRG